MPTTTVLPKRSTIKYIPLTTKSKAKKVVNKEGILHFKKGKTFNPIFDLPVLAA